MAMFRTGQAFRASDNEFGSGTTQTMPEIVGNAASSALKLNPTAAGDVVLFGDTDVADNADGKTLRLHRKAAEGDKEAYWYWDQFQRMNFRCDGQYMFECTSTIFFNPGASGAVVYFSSSTAGENQTVQIKGYITAASAAKYAYLQVDDANDEFLFGLQDANLTGIAIKLSDAAGASEWRIRTSAGAIIHKVDSLGNKTMADGADIILDTTTGTELATAANQKLGFWGTTPVVQPGHIADASTQDLTGGDTIDQTKLESDLANIVAAVNAILADMAEIGIQAAS